MATVRNLSKQTVAIMREIDMHDQLQHLERTTKGWIVFFKQETVAMATTIWWHHTKIVQYNLATIL